jgi:hypothetical protein
MIKDVDRDSKLTSLFIFDFVIALSVVGQRSKVASAEQRRATPKFLVKSGEFLGVSSTSVRVTVIRSKLS